MRNDLEAREQALRDAQEELAAERDFETGNYIELTHEQLARCIETGESPWPDESQD